MHEVWSGLNSFRIRFGLGLGLAGAVALALIPL